MERQRKKLVGEVSVLQTSLYRVSIPNIRLYSMLLSVFGGRSSIVGGADCGVSKRGSVRLVSEAWDDRIGKRNEVKRTSVIINLDIAWTWVSAILQCTKYICDHWLSSVFFI